MDRGWLTKTGMPGRHCKRTLQQIFLFLGSVAWSGTVLCNTHRLSARTHREASDSSPDIGEQRQSLICLCFMTGTCPRLFLDIKYRFLTVCLVGLERKKKIARYSCKRVVFSGGSDNKESTCNVGDPGSISGLGRSPGEGNGNPLSILAWRIPRTEEPGRLQSMGSQRVRHS